MGTKKRWCRTCTSFNIWLQYFWVSIPSVRGVVYDVILYLKFFLSLLSKSNSEKGDFGTVNFNKRRNPIWPKAPKNCSKNLKG